MRRKRLSLNDIREWRRAARYIQWLRSIGLPPPACVTPRFLVRWTRVRSGRLFDARQGQGEPE